MPLKQQFNSPVKIIGKNSCVTLSMYRNRWQFPNDEQFEELNLKWTVRKPKHVRVWRVDFKTHLVISYRLCCLKVFFFELLALKLN